MIVEINSSFYHLPCFDQLPQHSMIHKTYHQIKGTPEEQFLKEFINQVLIDEPVWGRNKCTYDNTKIKGEQRIFNFDYFFIHKFQHYHLTDFNNLSDSNYNNWTDVTIHNPNDNCCPSNGFLVHYQLLLNENKIVIHSVSKHGPNNPWNALFDLINPNNYGYDLCMSCNKKYPSSYPLCPYGCTSHNKISFVMIKEKIHVNVWANIINDSYIQNDIFLDLFNTQYVFFNQLNLNTYGNLVGPNIVINNLTDLYKL